MEIISTIQVPNPINSCVSKITLLNDPMKKTKAFADVRFGPFILHGFSIIQTEKDGKQNLFVMPPSRLDKARNKNYPHITVDVDFQRALFVPILQAYKSELAIRDAARKVENGF